MCALFGCVKDGMMCFQPWLKECVRMHYIYIYYIASIRFIHTVFAHMFHSFRIYELFVYTYKYIQLYEMN